MDERELLAMMRDAVREAFLGFVKEYESYVAPILRARGYRRKDSYERTVLFPFGEMTFTRSRWVKKGKIVIPLDEKLGLEKYQRHSKGLLYHITELGSLLPYQKVAQTIELLQGVHITKDTVSKALRQSQELREKKEEVEEKISPQKQTTKYLYVEGDGAMVKSTDKKLERHNLDLSHFVVHTGCQRLSPTRKQLLDKKEFISTKQSCAKSKLLDYLFERFDITSDTVLISNSDGGHGYGVSVFSELAKALCIKRHEHFWDAYHVHQKIKDITRGYPSEIRDLFFEGLRTHDWSKIVVAFDTLESLLEIDAIEGLLLFKKKFKQRFRYTKPPHLRGLPAGGIGIIESQHRKITYRMKRRGMYWSLRGAEIMAQTILDSTEKALEELFFGDWQAKDKKQRTYGMSATKVKSQLPKRKQYRLPKRY